MVNFICLFEFEFLKNMYSQVIPSSVRRRVIKDVRKEKYKYIDKTNTCFVNVFILSKS